MPYCGVIVVHWIANSTLSLSCTHADCIMMYYIPKTMKTMEIQLKAVEGISKIGAAMYVMEIIVIPYKMYNSIVYLKAGNTNIQQVYKNGAAMYVIPYKMYNSMVYLKAGNTNIQQV